VKLQGIDLDLRFLSGADEADVAVRYHGLDLQPAVARHHDQQGLRGRDHAADRMDRELLHHTVHGRRQALKAGLLLRLDQFLAKAEHLLLRLGEFVGERAPVFGARLAVGLANRRHGGLSCRWLLWTVSSRCCSTNN